jgi:uncharacterized membrane protein HdeD (DUF308 family)
LRASEQQLAKQPSWPMVALRGVLAVLFGVIALLWPELSVALLIYLFGAYALLDGALAVVGSLTRQPPLRDLGLTLVMGMVGVSVGIAVFVWPEITAVILLYFVAIRALVLGILDIVSAVVWREKAVQGWLLFAGGCASALFGLFALFRPGAGAMALLWLIGLYALVVGVLQVIMALVLRQRERELGLPAAD